jgi:acyl-CoA thioester hydrolase
LTDVSSTSPTSGTLAGGVHTLPLRVYWEDTDAAGIVYYANYLKFIERGRSDMLRLAGIDQWCMKDEDGVNFVVRRCEVDYHLPARLDDQIEVETRVEVMRGASLDMRQIVRREGEDLVKALIKVACVDASGKPVRLPPAIRNALV